MSQTNQTQALIEHWRSIGPHSWSQSDYGWLDIDNRPMVLAPWQLAVLEAWWEHRSVISTLAISNVKKTGKTTLNALLTCWRWLCLPGRHFVAANDLDQSSSLVFSMIAEMVDRHPYLSRNVKTSNTKLVFVPTGSSLEALSVDARGNAGANFLTSSHTEAWGIIFEGAIRSYEELTPPPGKRYGFPALRIVDSYAGFLDESTTWHGIVDRGLEGKRLDKAQPVYREHGLLLWHIVGLEAQKNCFRGTAAERSQYYAEQQRTLRVNAYSRLHLNERSTNESRFVEPYDWQACYNKELMPWGDGDSRQLVLGADASTSRDYTSLIGCTFDNGHVQAVLTKVWQPVRSTLRGGKPTIDLELTIGEAVLELHKAGRVTAVVCDPYQLHTLIIRWQKAGIKVIELAQNAGRVESDQALFDAIMSRSVEHTNNKQLNEAISNAVAIETPRGLRLAKEKSSKKIDAAVALSMAHYGALQKLAGTRDATTMPNIFMNEDLLAQWMGEEPHRKVQIIRTGEGTFIEKVIHE